MAVAVSHTWPTDSVALVRPEGATRDAPELATFVLLRRWADWMEVSGRFSEKTWTQYRRTMVRFIGDTLIPLTELTAEEVEFYLHGLPAKGQMRGQIIRTLQCFYRWASERDLIEKSPVRTLRVGSPKYGEAPYLTEEDLERVLKAAEKLDPRARPTLELIYATGARVGSMAGVLPEDIDLRHETIHFRVAKGDRPYTNPLGPRGLKAARELLALIDYAPPRSDGRRPTLVGVASCIIQRWAKESGEIAGVKLWCHLLRHTYCERISNDPNTPEIVVVELMNWRDGAQLRRYAPARLPLKRNAVAPL
jgi:integrase